MQGELNLELRELNGSKSQVILNASSNLCGLEVGGDDWDNYWHSH
jgi:tocopherol cyclase